MSTFTENLRVEVLDKWDCDRRIFRNLKAYEYHVGEIGSGVVVYIEKGFTTDFASIPWFLRWLLSPLGQYAKASTIHDDLYRRQIIYDNGVFRTVSKKEADNIFLEAMNVTGVSKWERRMVYLGVKFGGHRGWNRYTKLLKSQEAAIFNTDEEGA